MVSYMNIYSGDIGILFNIGDTTENKVTGDLFLLKLVVIHTRVFIAILDL